VRHREYPGGSGVSGADPAGLGTDLDSRSDFGNVPGLLRFASRHKGEMAFSTGSLSSTSGRHTNVKIEKADGHDAPASSL